ncbi:serine protease [Rhizobium sp. RCAM05350]|nr:serine protease [Rhizobium sp. RCAM05350]
MNCDLNGSAELSILQSMLKPEHLQAETIAAIHLAEKRLRIFLNDREEAERLIRLGLPFKGAHDVDKKIDLFKANYFSHEMFEALMCGGEGYRPAPIEFVWNKLCKRRIFHKITGHLPGAFADQAVNPALLLKHIHDDTFHNLFLPPSGLLDRYKGAVAAIDVLKNGDERRGSGFIVQLINRPDQVLITCRHNVDPDDGITDIRVSTEGGAELSVKTAHISSEYDIALMELRQPVQGTVFRLGSTATVFDEVYTLGFPHVVGAFPLLTGHRGEINGFAELFLEKCPAILISDLVSPGSSGGPVLNRDGSCIGMTMRWLESESEGGKTRFSAALPAKILMDVLGDRTTFF